MRPDGALVADAWLRLVAGVPSSCIGPTLPSARKTPPAPWVANGFVQHTLVGGAPGTHVPLRQPVVQLDFWAVTLDDRTAPWGRASALAETVFDATFGEVVERTLVVPAGYDTPRLRTVLALQEPRKIPGDPSGFARFSFDAVFTWTS